MGPHVDIFCQVIDNLGDIGVSWRLARQLQHEHGAKVRLYLDQLASLAKLEPECKPDCKQQELCGIQVLHWSAGTDWAKLTLQMPDIVIAAFSCELPDAYIDRLRQHPTTVWYQLEYLSAQSWVPEFHLQVSLRADGLKPVFFFPGFTEQTGGLIREKLIGSHDLQDNRQWLGTLGLQPDLIDNRQLVSVFTYPDAPVDQLARMLEDMGIRTTFLLPQGVRNRLGELNPEEFSHVSWASIAFLRQPEYDRLLACMDLNLVRGEDSFVRAIWAGKPFIWNIYPQSEDEHHKKLQAWLDLAQMPLPVCTVMHEWSRGQLSPEMKSLLTGKARQDWLEACLKHRGQLLSQSDLAHRLLKDRYSRKQQILP